MNDRIWMHTANVEKRRGMWYDAISAFLQMDEHRVCFVLEYMPPCGADWQKKEWLYG
ncbi:MAG: hypothetical protein IJ418_04830 [Clostridia bacterium]|nr:hypothetical protein [Clostridia bacterium]